MVDSYGPDRCRTTLDCIEYHDATPRIDGDLNNCCCCNTCISLRPTLTGDGLEYTHCCRCVPRLIFLQFIPDSPVENCCASASEPMVYAGTTDDVTGWPVTTYSGSLYGVSVTAELGRFDAAAAGSGSGSVAADGDCAWHVTATKGGSGAINIDEYYPVDQVVYSCLDVSNIEIGAVEGPEGCDGTLILANMESGRLPFVSRDIPSITQIGSGSGVDPEFIDVDCGECQQVCTVLCVYGNRRGGEGREFVEFHWFDNSGSIGSGSGGAEVRGWKYTSPSTAVVEIIWLKENEAGECYLDFDWVGNVLDDRVIDVDVGCSCGMKEVVTNAPDLPSVGITIRCGYCTCWDFFCGRCRCVPKTLCLQTYIGDTFTPNTILTWDEEERGWLGDDVGSGSGSGGTADIAIYLGANATTGACELTPYVDGVALDSVSGHDCGNEHVSAAFLTGGKVYDESNDFIATTFSDYIGVNDDERVWIMASSQVDECRPGACSTATPCSNACGGHPPQLTVRLHGWSGPEDEPDHPDVCDVEVEVYYFEQYSWAGESLDVECGYIGLKYICTTSGGNPTVIQVEINDGNVNVSFYDGATGPFTCQQGDLVAFATETCDPYAADTGEIVTGIQSCCWSCDAQIQRYQITVTE